MTPTDVTAAPVVHDPRRQGPGPGARVRAARVAGDLSREGLAARIGSSARTIRRIEDDQRQATPAELRSIAAACGAPEWFLSHGWHGWELVSDR